MKKNSATYLYLTTLLVLGIYLLLSTLDTEYWTPIDYLNLAIHEAGHMLFFFFGQFLHVLGGTVAQLIFPFLFVGYFFYQRDVAAASLMSLWFAQSLANVSIYAGDAITQALPMLTNGTHDWSYIFSRLGLLPYTEQISTFLYLISFIIALTSFIVLVRELYKRALI